VKTAQQALARWQGAAGTAATDWAAGINGYTGDWAGVTVAAYNNWVSGLANAQAQGLWQSGVANAGTAKWKTNSQNKAANYTTGYTAGATAFGAAIQKIIAAEQNIVNSLPPRGSYAQNVARMTTFVDDMHALRGQLRA
jgi:hypothetical protein